MSHTACKYSRGSGLAVPIFIVGMLVAVILNMIGTSLLLGYRPDLSSNMMAQEYTMLKKDEPHQIAAFKVYYKDFYYLDISMNNENPLTFSIVDAKGNVVYECHEKNINQKDIKLKLSKGEYQILLSEPSQENYDGFMNISYTLD